MHDEHSSDHPFAQPFDILAIAAHRDDVEQTCGGTLLKAAERGQRTAILDLTRGEMGTRGTPDDRAREAADAARLLKVSYRQALDIPDGRVENTWDNRLKVARVVRALRPRVVILPYWQGRHPDHYTACTIGYEGCFIAGFKKLELTAQDALREAHGRYFHGKLLNEEHFRQEQDYYVHKCGGSLAPHRPFKIVYSTLYYDVRPTFVVDISDQFEVRLRSLFAYKSQYEDQAAGSQLFPAQQEIRERIETMARYFGLLAGVKYAEPFVQKEVGLVDDLLAIPVQSI